MASWKGRHTGNAYLSGVAQENIADLLLVAQRGAGFYMCDAAEAPAGVSFLGATVSGDAMPIVARQPGMEFTATYSGTVIADDYVIPTTNGLLVTNGTSGSTVIDDGSGIQSVARMKEITDSANSVGTFYWI